MRFRVFLAALAVAVLSVFSIASAEPNGRNVNFARFGDGTIERSYTGEWLEFGAGSTDPKFTWRESHRDDWSVYLRDESRSMDMQIDLHRKVIRLAWPGKPMFDWTALTEASDRINGRLASAVSFSGGQFVKQGPYWQEYGLDGAEKFRFEERGRDEWSVYLRDDSRSMDMQIDLHRNMIRLGWPGREIADWAPIQSAR